jgi:hypothetical protein
MELHCKKFNLLLKNCFLFHEFCLVFSHLFFENLYLFILLIQTIKSIELIKPVKWATDDIFLVAISFAKSQLFLIHEVWSWVQHLDITLFYWWRGFAIRRLVRHFTYPIGTKFEATRTLVKSEASLLGDDVWALERVDSAIDIWSHVKIIWLRVFSATIPSLRGLKFHLQLSGIALVIRACLCWIILDKILKVLLNDLKTLGLFGNGILLMSYSRGIGSIEHLDKVFLLLC